MHVDIDEAGRHQLALCVEHLPGVGLGDVLGHAADRVSGDGHVAHRGQLLRRVDHPAVLDEQVVARRGGVVGTGQTLKSLRHAAHEHAGHGVSQELASGAVLHWSAP